MPLREMGREQMWMLPPTLDELLKAGEIAAEGAAQRLVQLRQERDRVTVTVARREFRKWLRESPEGRAVEEAVRELLEKKVDAHSSLKVATYANHAKQG